MQFTSSGSGPNLEYVPPTPPSTVWLFSQPSLSQINKTYRNIITTNCFPPGAFRVDKYWPAVNRVDNVHGDRHLICTCPPMSDYAEAAE